MTRKEKYLYHQIHPLKLLADWASGIVALLPLWRHELGVALGVMFVPPPVASWLVIRFANLEPYRDSPFGRYVARSMTRMMEAMRLAGFVTMAAGAWTHSMLAVVLGLLVVLFAWFRGALFPSR